MPIELKAASLGYQQQVIIRQIDLQVPQGQVTALIGPNGSGKSTLLKAMAGQLKPLTGEILLEQQSIDRLPRKQLARRLSYLPQSPVTPENTTVEQLIEQGRYCHRPLFGGLSKTDREAIEWAGHRAGILPFFKRYVSELSGGERQRVWIAAALAQQAKTILLDEPTTYLDLGHQLEVLELLQQLSREEGISVVLSLHEINHALMFADCVKLMFRGQLLYSGEAQGLTETALLESTFAIDGHYMQSQHTKPLFVATRSLRQQQSALLE